MIEFSYDNNGLRTRKSVKQNGITTNTDYILHGKLLTALIQGTDKLFFFYDAQSRPAFMTYDGKDYAFVQNLQGDIVAILDGSGNKVVEYAYDAWGRHTKTQSYAVGSTTLATATKLASLNPFRYRSYVYDEETKLYYLRSRYYNPEWVRFLNADVELISGHAVLKHNQFAYAANNPANCVDNDGERVFFINGINNTDPSGIPEQARSFKREYENMYYDNVVIVPVYQQIQIYGAGIVLAEHGSIDIYTTFVEKKIREDIEKNPLKKDEKVTLVGYSGGGVLAIKSANRLRTVADHVVTIGAPIIGNPHDSISMEGFSTPITRIWSNTDILSRPFITSLKYYNLRITGLDHGGYFSNLEQLRRIAGLTGLIGGAKPRSQ